MGLGSSSDTNKDYTFLQMESAEYWKLNLKIQGVLSQLRLSKAFGDTYYLVAIPKYWSMRTRAIFLHRLSGKQLLQAPDSITMKPGQYPEPNLKVLEEIDKLPMKKKIHEI